MRAKGLSMSTARREHHPGSSLWRAVLLASLLFAVALLPRPAGACAVCYGDVDSPMTEGVNNGILVLLGVVASVQLGFAALFLNIRQRARRHRRRRARFDLIQGGID